MVGLPLRNLGQLALWQGDYAAARPYLEQSLAAFRANGERLNTVPVLAHLGWLAQREGIVEQAAAWFRACLAASQEIGYTSGVAAALDDLAGVVALQGELTRAARMLGTAAVVQGDREQTELVLAALAQQTAAAVRAGLGEEAFAAAWAAGRALSLEQAVAEALAIATRPDVAEMAPRRGSGDSVPGGLTAREVEVLRLLAGGLSNLAIAERLVLSVKTVERHIANVYAKIGAHGRVDATTFALRHSLLADHSASDLHSSPHFAAPVQDA